MLKTSNEGLTSFDVFIARYTEKTSNKDTLNFTFSLGTRMFYVYCLSKDCDGNFIVHMCYPSVSFSVLFGLLSLFTLFYFRILFLYFVTQTIFIPLLLTIKSILVSLCVLHSPLAFLELLQDWIFPGGLTFGILAHFFSHMLIPVNKITEAHFPACDPPQD